MSISNGQDANQTNFNNAFMSRTQDTNTLGKLDLNNGAGVSGASIANIQRVINSICSATGMTTAEVYNFLFTWANNYVGAPNDTVKDRIEALITRFAVGGHTHDGTNGEGPLITSVNISNVPLFARVIRATDIPSISAGVASVDVSALMTGETPSVGDTIKGWPVNNPYNKVILRESDGTLITTTGGPTGEEIYGRLTESAGTWTVTFFYIDSLGVETAVNFPSAETNVRWYSQKLINPITDTGYTYDDGLFIPSTDIVSDMPDASTVQSGKVNISTQTFGGDKTFNSHRVAQEFHLSVSNDAATTGSNALMAAPTTPFIRATNASLVSINMIDSTSPERFFVWVNATGADVVFKNLNGGTSSKQIITGTSSDLTAKNGSSLWFAYDTTSAKWRIIGGSGGGGTAYQESLGTGDGIVTSFGPTTFVPIDDKSVAVFKNGVLVDDSEWSLSGSNIIFSVAPAAATSIYVYYLASGSPSVPVVSGLVNVDYITLTGTDITNKYVTLTNPPLSPSKVMLDIIGGTSQEYAVDFQVSGSNLDWNGLALDGVLVVGDKFRVWYQS